MNKKTVKDWEKDKKSQKILLLDLFKNLTLKL